LKPLSGTSCIVFMHLHHFYNQDKVHFFSIISGEITLVLAKHIKKQKKTLIQPFYFQSVHFVKMFVQVVKSDSCKNKQNLKSIHALPEKKSAISLKSIGTKKAPFVTILFLSNYFKMSIIFCVKTVITTSSMSIAMKLWT
jgi:hypothetical protein